VLINLLSNAIKYSAGGTVKVEIHPHDGKVEMAVSDQGKGISQKDISRLFQPYTRLDRTQSVKGTGVGLFITKGIVQAHNGEINVESELGKGTTFRISIPARE
jgi:signal transduction histidine kinase